MSKITFRIGGVHPDDNKISRNCAIETLPLPPTVYVSMSQHIGALAKPVVAAGDKVKVGQVIAEPGGFVSAFIHSPVSGTVKGLVERRDLGQARAACRNHRRGRRVGRRHRPLRQARDRDSPPTRP